MREERILLEFTIHPIGVIRSCFKEKFATPRQAGLAPSASAEIEFIEPYKREEMVKGLERFSHIWVQFLFHEAIPEGWKTSVRPPRLGGRRRMGVFGTRSPHRPNHLGLSAVRLLGIKGGNGRLALEIGGADLIEGTPVVDIKPYIPSVDCLLDASCGWLSEEFITMNIVFLDEAAAFCRDYERRTGRRLSKLIREILEQDPRPASQRDKKHHFGMILWEVNIRWKIENERYVVTSCEIVPESN